MDGPWDDFQPQAATPTVAKDGPWNDFAPAAPTAAATPPAEDKGILSDIGDSIKSNLHRSSQNVMAAAKGAGETAFGDVPLGISSLADIGARKIGQAGRTVSEIAKGNDPAAVIMSNLVTPDTEQAPDLGIGKFGESNIQNSRAMDTDVLDNTMGNRIAETAGSFVPALLPGAAVSYFVSSGVGQAKQQLLDETAKTGKSAPQDEQDINVLAKGAMNGALAGIPALKGLSMAEKAGIAGYAARTMVAGATGFGIGAAMSAVNDAIDKYTVDPQKVIGSTAKQSGVEMGLASMLFHGLVNEPMNMAAGRSQAPAMDATGLNPDDIAPAPGDPSQNPRLPPPAPPPVNPALSAPRNVPNEYVADGKGGARPLTETEQWQASPTDILVPSANGQLRPMTQAEVQQRTALMQQMQASGNTPDVQRATANNPARPQEPPEVTQAKQTLQTIAQTGKAPPPVQPPTPAPQNLEPQPPVPVSAPQQPVQSHVGDQNVNTAPSDAQKEAGNYSKGHLSIQGLPLTVENPAGSVRAGQDAAGNPWQVQMPVDYGYIKGTTGADGDHVDAFVGPDTDSKKVFLVDQKDPATGQFDEHKALIGFNDPFSALNAYEGSFSDNSGASRIGGFTPMDMDSFKGWLKNRDTTQPLMMDNPPKDNELSVNLSAATGTIPGLDKLVKSANNGDQQAQDNLHQIAHESITHLVSGIPSARLEIDNASGLYGGSLEPSLGIKMRFDENDRPAALAALAKFAENYNQEQIHVRQDAPENADVGDKFGDGSFVTPVYRFNLKKPMSRKDIESIADKSGLPGFTATDKYLEVYYAGDPSDSAAIAAFNTGARKAGELVGKNGQGTDKSLQRLWAYGSEGTPFERIRGDLPAPQEQQAQTPRLIAEGHTGSKVTPARQQNISKPQRALQKNIADAYDALPQDDLSNPLVQKAYGALTSEVKQQYESLPVKVDVWDKKGEPYKGSADMRRDVADNNHLWIYGTTPETFGPEGSNFAGHPLLQDSGLKSANGKPLLMNDLLRAVHDYYAHNLSPVQFGPKGEEAAWKNHMASTLDPWARWALTSETRGQNSWVNFRPGAEGKALPDRGFAVQKAALMPIHYALTGDAKVDAPMRALANELPPIERNGSLRPQLDEPTYQKSPDNVMNGQALSRRNAQPGQMPAGSKMVAKGLAGEPTAKFNAKEADFVKAVNDIRDKMFPQANTRFMKSMTDVHSGEDIQGAYYHRDLSGKNIAPVIAASMRAGDPAGVARHEGIHFLYRNGYFHPNEWRTLTEAAKDKNWIGKHGIDKLYGDAPDDLKTEEAIAEEFSKGYGNGWRGAPEAVRQIFRKVALFMRRLAAAARTILGKKATADDIFNRVESGEVGSRTPFRARGENEPLYQKNFKDELPKKAFEEVIKNAVQKVEDYFDEKFKGTMIERAAQAYQHVLAPESISNKSLLADAFLAQTKVKEQNAASAIAQIMQKYMDDWDKKSTAQQKQWISDYEQGKSNDPYDAVHKAWMDATHKKEAAEIGREPDDYYRDNYVAHLYDKPKEAQAWIDRMVKKYGSDWFTKKRSFDLAEEAEKAGFKLRTTNPAELDQMRLMAGSDMVEKMRLLKLFAKNGLAGLRADKDTPQALRDSNDVMVVRGPDNKEWLLHGDIAPLWRNAMEQRGLWSNKTIIGDAYRGWQLYRRMQLPIKLGLSLFHPFHVYTIHWGTGISSAMENAIKAPNLAQAAKGFSEGMGMAIRGGFGPKAISIMRPFTKSGTAGQRFKSMDSPLLQAVKTPAPQRTELQKAIVKRFEEGGFRPLMSEQDKIHFRRPLVKALNNRQFHKAIFPVAGAAIRSIGVPFMEHWIPAMKAEAYMMRTNMALRRDPTLVDDDARRAVAFRQITKDLERTYGEMNYDTLFWNKNLRDAVTGSFISGGWKLAQLYYYMGHPAVQVPKLMRAWAKTGKMSFTGEGMKALSQQVTYQSLFYLAYMALSLAAGGAITYLLTGEKPKDKLDLRYPRTGDVAADGTPVRISLPFFNKEGDSWKYNVDQKGPIMGTASFIGSMAMLPEAWHMINNEDAFGNPLVDQFNWEQLSHAAINQINPISVSSAQKAELKGSDRAKYLAFLGAGPAPNYAGQTTFQNKVAGEYFKQHPPSSSEYQKDLQNSYKLAVMHGDADAQNAIADKLEKTGMSGKQINNLTVEHRTPFTDYAWRGNGGKGNGWAGLSAESQIRLYKYATPEEQQHYFPMMKTEAKSQVEPPTQ